MDYKKILLFGLFLPIFCCAKDNVDRLEELEELRCELVLKIRRQEKIISEGEEFLRHATSIYEDLVRQAAEKRKKKLEAVTQENDLICHELVEALRGRQKFKRSLIKELFDPKSFKKKNAFNSDKFLVTRAIMEQELLRVAIIEYEKYVQNLIKINKEIRDLKKELGIHDDG